MRNTFMFGVLVMVGGGWFASAAAQTKPVVVPKDDVPDVVLKAIDKAAPGTKWLVHTFWEEKIGTVYRAFGRDDQDRLVESMTKADGEVIDVRTKIQTADVPKTVRDALATAMPDFKPKQTQAVGRVSGTIIYYRFVGETGGKVTVIIASTDGEKVLKGY